MSIFQNCAREILSFHALQKHFLRNRHISAEILRGAGSIAVNFLQSQ